MATCLSKQTLKFLKQQLHILHSDLDFFKKEAENICVKIANDEENIYNNFFRYEVSYVPQCGSTIVKYFHSF